jgi:uncharacterized protein (TIGR00251 family)
MIENAFSEWEGGIRISVYAQPGARKTEFVGFHDGSVKIRVQAPPVDGKANSELIRFLAAHLGVKRGDVSLFKGDKNRNKVFEISGVTLDRAQRCFLA